MMTMPDPGVLDSLIRDRQADLQASPKRRVVASGRPWRVRVGHALIVAGATLSGERVEHPPRPAALSRAS